MTPRATVRIRTAIGLLATLFAPLTFGVAVGAQTTQPPATRATLPPLHHESVAWDAARGRLVVVFSAGDSLDGTWEWNGREWTMAADSASSPTWRYGATIGYDPGSQRLMLFGGWRGYPQAPAAFTMFCDTWAFDGRRWTRLNNDPCITTRVRNNSLVYHPGRRAMLLLDGTPEVPSDTTRPLRIWQWSGRAWALIDSLGPRRAGWDRGVYDEARSVIVFPVFDGLDAGVWEWDGERWRRITATGPAARHVYGLQYDPQRRRVVLVGGQTFTRPSTYLRDAWTWDGTRWTELALGGAPGERSGGHLINDAGNRRLLYFGGYRGPPMQMLQELWTLDGEGWRRLQP